MLRVLPLLLNVLYLLVRLFVHRRDGITLICCQDDEPTADMLMLYEELRAGGAGESENTPKLRLHAGRMRRNPVGAARFFIRLFSQMISVAGSRVVVIDAYSCTVSLLRHRRGTAFIQMWHAPEAIKKFSLQILDTAFGQKESVARAFRMHRGYTHILCPSEATLPFFKEAFGYPDGDFGDIFVKLGLPVLDRVAAAVSGESGEALRAKIFARYPGLGIRPLVLYAPTFRDGNPVETGNLIRAFEEAEKSGSGIGFDIVVKLHPLDFITRAGGAESCAFVIYDTEFPTESWYAVSDAVITDYSGVAVDAAAAGIASYYYIYDIDEYAESRGLNVDLREEETGKYAFADAPALARQIHLDFPGTRGMQLYDYKALAAFKDKYLEVPLTGNTRCLAEFIYDILTSADGSFLEET